LGTDILIPFTGGFDHRKFLPLTFLFEPALIFFVLGTDNGLNFTDSLDSLCTTVTILVATFLTVVAIRENAGIRPITGAVVGSRLGLLLFNPASALLIIADTGSLDLGGFVSPSELIMPMPLCRSRITVFYLVDVLYEIILVTHLHGTGCMHVLRRLRSITLLTGLLTQTLMEVPSVISIVIHIQSS